MNNFSKIGFILALVIVSLMMVSTVSAGFFDFLGGNDSSANDDSTFIVGFDAKVVFSRKKRRNQKAKFTGSRLLKCTKSKNLTIIHAMAERL